MELCDGLNRRQRRRTTYRYSRHRDGRESFRARFLEIFQIEVQECKNDVAVDVRGDFKKTIRDLYSLTERESFR